MTNIVLTGPMGSGKTTVGALAARKLGRRFVDTDAMVEALAGADVRRIFIERGEAGFRALESEVIRKLSGEGGMVIATGGGAVLDPGNMRRLRMNGVIVNLKAHLNVLAERLKDSAERPLLDGKGSTLRGYMWNRAPLYLNHDFAIDTGIADQERTAAEVARIAGLPVVRICASISGTRAARDIVHAARNGATMAELRLDLIPDPDVDSLVKGCPLPVIATQRGGKHLLKQAIAAGCDYIDLEHDSPERGEIIGLAKGAGCRVILSMHDGDGVPDRLPERADADFVKVAAAVRTAEDIGKLERLQSGTENLIIVPMGQSGTDARLRMPLFGSHIMYCHVGTPTAPGQPELGAVICAYRGMGLR